MTANIRDLIVYTCLLLFILIASLSDARANDDEAYYFGISGGQTRVKNTTTQQYQDATSFGLKFGLRLFSNDAIWTGAELKYTQTTAKEQTSQTGSSTSSSYEVETTGLYLTARTRGKAYVKAKLGAANQVITVDNSVIQDSTRTSYGVGAGVRQGHAVLEVEYTQYGDDVTIFSVGYVF